MSFSPVLAKIKLPPRPQKMLGRSRLLDFLYDYADVKLAAVSATAGYGKTSLLIDYAHGINMPVCWYTLDRFDREPGTFFAYLLSCIRRQFPDFGAQSEAVLASLQNPGRDWVSLAAMLVNELYETVPDYFTIILDDYHHIEDVAPINEFLAYLLQYSDEHFHMVIASRRLPMLPNQALLLARGQMVGLDTEELRFTAQEIQALAKQGFGFELSDGKAAELSERFEGWITAILLAARPGWKKLLATDIRPDLSGPVYNYLAEQVFADQPTDLQTFLLESAVLEQMSAEMLDALREADDSALMLAQVGNRNLFLIPLVGEEGEYRWFRYHALFGEFLQNRLRSERRERFEALHRSAARLFENRQQWAKAFDHYAIAGDEKAMVQLFEMSAEELYTTGRWDTLQSWIDALPVNVVDANPLLVFYQGLMLVERGDPTLALQYAERAWHAFEERNDAFFSGRSLLLQATALRLLGRYADSLNVAQQALAAAAQLNSKRLLAGAQRAVGVGFYRMGRAEPAIEHLESALELYQALGHVFFTAQLFHELGVAYRAVGQWRKAVGNYQQALSLWERLNNLGAWATTLNSVGVVHHLRGEFVEARQALSQALEKAEVAGYRRMQAFVLASLGDLYRDSGRYQAAHETFRRSADLADALGEGFISFYARQALGEACRLLGNHEQAIIWLSEAAEQAKSHGSFYEMGLCEMARGIVWVDMDRQAQAWISLGQAKEFFERSGHLHELARTYFHLSHLAFRQSWRQGVEQYLGLVAGLAQRLGYNNFLVVEGRQAKALLKYAVSLNGDNGWWAHILDLASRPPALLADEHQEIIPASSPPLQIFALGQDRIQYANKEAKSGRPKVREFFFYLLLHRAQGVHREQIMAEFWPEATPSRATLSFKSALYRLRRLYSDVNYQDGWYILDLPEGSWYDVEVFKSLLDEAQAAGNERDRADAYRRALALYGGDYLEVLDSLWCTLERERLRVRCQQALHALADLLLAQGEYDESLLLYRQALAVDEFDEAACRGLLRSYAGVGQRSQALAFYHQFAENLYREMGISPAPETAAVHQELLNQYEDG